MHIARIFDGKYIGELPHTYTEAVWEVVDGEEVVTGERVVNVPAPEGCVWVEAAPAAPTDTWNGTEWVAESESEAAQRRLDELEVLLPRYKEDEWAFIGFTPHPNAKINGILITEIKAEKQTLRGLL